MILMAKRQTDALSQFDMRQLLLFGELVQRYQPRIGRKAALCQATDEMPLVFDSPTMMAAARKGDGLLPSYLAQELSWVSRRSDWVSRQESFVALRAAHIAEAELRRQET
jgi:hypothetical protein